MNARWPRRGLYAITPDEPDTGRLLARVEPVLRAGATWLQYRNKAADDDLRAEQAIALLPLCRGWGVPLIINDDWALAAAIGADGAHLGRDDGEIALARHELGPEALLGASCYADLRLARQALFAGADYVAFGAFFPSATKPDAVAAPLAVLEEAAALGLPRVAIGGITPDNAGKPIAMGAELVAVVGAVFDAPDPVAAARALVSRYTGSP